jgi:membrane-associated protease RseP (regulator of RpoE activity)
VNTAEVAVAVVASGSLLASIGGGGIDFGIVAAMLIGGVIASPIAAWSIRFMPARALGLGVGALLLTANIRELATWADVGAMRWVGYGAAVIVTAVAALRPRIAERLAQRRIGLDPAAI